MTLRRFVAKPRRPLDGGERGGHLHRMLRVDEVELREIRLPLREPFRISSGTSTDRRILLLHLRHPEGPSCWAECVAGEHPNYSSETIDTAWLALREWFVPRILGIGFERPEEVAEALSADVRGHRMARAALEMGMWNLAAHLKGEPLARLLGGARERVETGISLGIQESPAAIAEKARAALRLGYRKVKLKIRPGEDVAHVRTVREALGPDAPLAVDANASYTPAETEEMDALGALDEFGLMMIEQPFPADGLAGHARLQQRLRTPICLDESITGPARAEDMIALGAGRIVNLKPGRVGGFAPSLAIHRLCRDAGVPLWCGGMLETGIGRGYNVALASLPGFTLPGDLSPSARYWERDVVVPEWTMDRGWVAVPAAPGLGVAVERDRVEDLTVRRERLRLPAAGSPSGGRTGGATNG